MSDLIDRREAIIAAIDAADEWDGGSNVCRAKIITRVLKALPSAQTQWIPVTERLPEQNKEVLVISRHIFYIAVFEDGCWNEVIEYRSLENVTAWMPLPEPWKG